MIFFPVISWFILSFDFEVELWEGFFYRPWRLLALAFTSTVLVSSLLFMLFPESPKYYIAMVSELWAFIKNLHILYQSFHLLLGSTRFSPENVAMGLCEKYRQKCWHVWGQKHPTGSYWRSDIKIVRSKLLYDCNQNNLEPDSASLQTTVHLLPQHHLLHAIKHLSCIGWHGSMVHVSLKPNFKIIS